MFEGLVAKLKASLAAMKDVKRLRSAKARVDGQYGQSLAALDAWRASEEAKLAQCEERMRNRLEAVDVKPAEPPAPPAQAADGSDDGETERLLAEAERLLSKRRGRSCGPFRGCPGGDCHFLVY